MIKTENIYFQYGKRKILKDVNVHLVAGKVNIIIGPNGCGKSTLLKVVSRCLKPRKGKVLYKNNDLFTYNTKLLAKEIALLPQNPKVPDDFSVNDMVSFGRFPYTNWTGKLSETDYNVINWAIKSTNLNELAYRNICTLSGGERQRAYIAMALAQQPKVLLLDEPTTFLDISHQFEVLELIRKLNEENNITTVMVLHDINHAMQYGDYIVAMKEGRIICQGNKEDIITKDIIEEVFHVDVKFVSDHESSDQYVVPVGRRIHNE